MKSYSVSILPFIQFSQQSHYYPLHALDDVLYNWTRVTFWSAFRVGIQTQFLLKPVGKITKHTLRKKNGRKIFPLVAPLL